MFNYFIFEPIKKKRLSLIPLRIAQVLHDRTAGRSNASFRRLGKMLWPKIILPPSSQMNEEAITASTNKINQRGWDILPYQMSASDILELRRFAFSTSCYANNPDEKIRITEGSIPNDSGLYVWRMTDLFQLPVIQRLLKESPLHDIAERYIGSRPTLTSLSLWLNPVYNKKFDAHIYHYDNDGPAFLKFFIYLNDVDMDSGAHVYIESSQREGKPDFLSRSKRYDRSELLNYYGTEKEIIFSAPAGTIIAEDTSGFHKGTTPKKNYRLLLVVQYAMFDIPHIEEFSPDFKKIHIEGLNPAIKQICRKFVT